VPAEVVEMLQEIRERMGLARAGFDLIGKSFDQGLHIIEVNGRPNLWTHIEPDVGPPRPVARIMLELGSERAMDEATAQSVLAVCRDARAF
jgi:glutathione synthase/RimK-type ligase-like ATP-grasp enzyme